MAKKSEYERGRWAGAREARKNIEQELVDVVEALQEEEIGVEDEWENALRMAISEGHAEPIVWQVSSVIHRMPMKRLLRGEEERHREFLAKT